jgi:hypothetical protein
MIAKEKRILNSYSHQLTTKQAFGGGGFLVTLHVKSDKQIPLKRKSAED